MIRWHLLLLMCMGSAAVTSIVHAADVQVSAAVRTDGEHEQIDLGDVLEYWLTIEGATDVQPPNVQADGLTIQFAGEMNQPAPTMIVNGRRIDTGADKYHLRYRVRANQPGTFTIPAQHVVVAGETHTTNPVSVRIVEPPISEYSALEIELEREDAYVGEPIELQVRWYFTSTPRDMRFMTNTSNRDVQYLDVRPSVPRHAQSVTVRFDDREVLVVATDGDLNGVPCTVVTITQIIVPGRAGDLTIGPVTAFFDEVVSRRGFGFFQEEDKQPRMARSEPVTLRALPLPDAGRPADFNGLIGRYDIRANASDTLVNVGDPITLRVEIEGPEPMSVVNPPNLEAHESLSGDFKLSPEGWQAESVERSGVRAWTTTIRPRDEGVTMIPSIGLPYFDTKSGTYARAETGAIELTVRPTREVTIDQAEITPVPGRVTSTLEPLEDGPGGVRANIYAPDALISQAFNLDELVSRPLALVLLIAPPLAFTLVAAVSFVARRRDPVAERRRGALRRALHALKRNHERTPAHVEQTVRRYIADRFTRDAAALTSRDCRQLLDAVSASRAQEVSEFLNACASDRFLNGHERGSTNGISTERAETLLRAIDRELRS